MKYSKEVLDTLRENIRNTSDISDKRKTHIFAVEDMAVRLGELYIPEKLDILRAAALLHDITKEYTMKRQVDICRENGHEPDLIELYAPKTLHSHTAAYIIPKQYAEFNDREVISAVRWHTTGHAGMTLTEKLIYLADYIEETRRFADCITLRYAFFNAEPEKMSMSERCSHLREILIMSYDMTISALLEESSPISPYSVEALNELLCEKLEKNKK